MHLIEFVDNIKMRGTGPEGQEPHQMQHPSTALVLKEGWPGLTGWAAALQKRPWRSW